jgi:predicted transcriptional regulator
VKRLRLSRLSSKLSITIQETSRQLSRLQKARLVEKDSEGLFTLTGFGRLALKLLPSLDFLVGRRDYLLHHDLSFLPSEFIERIGELAEGEYGETLGAILNHFEEVLSESREYVWLMADQVLLTDSIAEKVMNGDGVSMRIVIPSAVVKKEDYTPLPSDFKGKVELGLVDEVRVGLALNERLAGVAFPDNTGKVDFGSGLRGNDLMFHKWCADLFLFHWNKARRIF